MDYFSKIIDDIGLSMHKNCILEFFRLITDGNTRLPEIVKRIGVEKINIDVLKALFSFVLIASKFFIYTKPKFDKITKFEQDPRFINNDNLPDPILNGHRIRYKEKVTFAKLKLERYIHLFIKKNTIKVKAFGVKGVFSNIKSFMKEVFEDLGGDNTLENILDAKSFNSHLSKAEIEKFEINTVNSVSNYVINSIDNLWWSKDLQKNYRIYHRFS